MVDYNQSLDPPEACRRIARFAEFDLDWVEEPVAAEDLAGHARVRAATGVRVQTGENWWFPRDMQKAMSAGASDFAMLDIMKIGGVTGWLRAAGQAEAASLPVSSHIFVEASAHVLAGDADRALARAPRPRRRDPRRAVRGRRRHDRRQGAGARDRLGRGGRRAPRPLGARGTAGDLRQG